MVLSSTLISLFEPNHALTTRPSTGGKRTVCRVSSVTLGFPRAIFNPYSQPRSQGLRESRKIRGPGNEVVKWPEKKTDCVTRSKDICEGVVYSDSKSQDLVLT